MTPPRHGTLSGIAPALTYTPNADYAGSDDFTFLVNDGSHDSAPGTVSVTVEEVNDAPSFTKGVDPTAPLGAGPQIIQGWATAVTAGPPSESSQGLSFALSNDNNGLFLTQPSMDPSGELMFTPGNTPGSATVTIVLSDNGGTSNGGFDTAAVQTFTISLRQVPPSASSSQGNWIEASVDQDVEFDLTASDSNGDLVSLTLLNPPPGSVFPPVLNGTVPVVRRFRWRPEHYQLGLHRLEFRVNDGTHTVSYAVTIQVGGTNFGVGAGIVIADVTGDGVLDFVVGASRVDVGGVANAGAVFVWAGRTSPAGPPTATLTRPVPVANDLLGSLPFGQGLLVEDVTGDGIVDILVGGASLDTGVTDAGAVHVWAGGSSLVGAPPPTATLVNPSPTAGDQLGYIGGAQGIVLGDVTGDGVLDVVVGGRHVDTSVVDAGAVFVWAGGTGLVGSPLPVARLLNPTPNASDMLGYSGGQGIRLADVTGDGIRDLVVAGSQVDISSVVNAGAVFVWSGGATLTGTPSPLATLVRPTPQVGDQLSHTRDGLTLGDVTGDGVIDIIVCGDMIDTSASNAGAILVWAGGSGLLANPLPTATLQHSSPSLDDFLGRDVLALGDVTGDGVLDIVVAGSYVDTSVANAGLVFVWAGGGVLVGTPSPRATLQRAAPVAEDYLARTGVYLRDVTGNGTLDVVVTGFVVDTSAANAGVVLLWEGGAGLIGTPAPRATLRKDPPTAQDTVGGILWFGDVTGDGILDLIVQGAYVDTTIQNAGVVLVWAGGAALSGIPAPTATLHNPSAAVNDFLGIKVRVCDVTGDGILDVVAGTHYADTSVSDAGVVLVWAGGPSLAGTPTPTATLQRTSPVADDELGNGGAGQWILFGDVTGDGVLDIVAGSYNIDTSVVNAGAALVWRGGPGLQATPTPIAELTDASPNAGDSLGYAHSSQGLFLADTTGDGVLDVLAVGTEADTTVVDSGAAYMWTGSNAMSGSPSAKFVHVNPTTQDYLGRMR